MHQILWLTAWAVVLESALLSMLSIALVVSQTWATVPAVVLASIVAGLIPFCASLIATFNQRLAARIYLCVAPIAFLLIPLFSSEFWGMLGTAVVFSGALLIPGFFWHLASRLIWPSPIPRSFPAQRPGLATGLAVGVLGLWVVGALVCSLSLPWWAPIGDCGFRPLLDENGAPRNIDFTARLLFVGPKSFLGKSFWSIAHVEENFSSMPLPNIVILQGFFEPSGRSVTYFVEGYRSHAALLRFLPVIDPVPCGRTQPAAEATAYLRILRDGPPKSGARLIGNVRVGPSWKPLGGPIPGVEISIMGPAGPMVSVTDSQGVYDVHDLLPGQYIVHAQIQDAQGKVLQGGGDAKLKTGEVGEANLYLH